MIYSHLTLLPPFTKGEMIDHKSGDDNDHKELGRRRMRSHAPRAASHWIFYDAPLRVGIVGVRF